MKRSRRTNSPFKALLLGIVVPVTLLLALFSLMPYEVMTRHWPLGVQRQEVEFFQRWFDRRPAEVQVDSILRFDLDSIGAQEPVADASAVTRWFSTTGYRDSVQVMRSLKQADAWRIDFPERQYYQGQRSVVLIPADLASIRARFAQLVAEEQGTVMPEVGLVRLYIGGKDRGVFTCEERITPDMLERQGFAEVANDLGVAKAVDGNAEMEARTWTAQRAAQGDTAHMDPAAVTTLGLLRYALDQRDNWDPRALFDRSRGRWMPVDYAVPRQWKDLFGDNATAGTWPWLQTPQAHTAMRALAERLRADSARWSERFAAEEATWAAALSGGASIGYVQARLASERKAFLTRLFAPAPEAVFGDPVPAGALAQAPLKLDPWLAPYAHGDTLRFDRGVHTIDHDIEVPRGMSVIIGKGARFFIAPGRSLVVNGPLYMRGTDPNPVFIRPVDANAPYGVIAVHGDGNTPCVLRGVRMSGGSSAWIAGRYHSGMLTFQDCKVTLEDCTISGSGGEDAVNVKRGQVRLIGCVFSAAKDDLVDLDYTRGEVRGCTFVGAMAGDTLASNGDGLDLSDSRILVEECHFEGLGDKGLSAGEGTEVFVQGSVFRNNTLGMAVKDRSVAHAERNVFAANKKVFGVYRKKSVFGGGTLTVFGNTYEGNAAEREVDAHSTFTEGTAADTKALDALRLK